MTVIADIKSALGDMVTAFSDATAPQYRLLTSAPNASPRTYGAWTDLTGGRTYNKTQEQERRDDQETWVRVYRATLSYPGTLSVSLTVRDQIRIGGAGGTTWNVSRVVRAGAGSVQLYEISYAIPMYEDPRIGGGV